MTTDGMEKKEIKLNGYLLLENTGKPLGNSAYDNVPKNWIGKKIATILLEPLEEKD
jgi:putative transposon-encoded protein